MLYPLKFRPRLLENPWGGRKFQGVLGRLLPGEQPVGESWELYDFPPGMLDGNPAWVSSQVVNGPLAGRTLHDCIDDFGADVYGNVPMLAPRGQFPVCIKLLDARENLCVQVHPDAAYAAAHPGASPKTKAWYILQADPGAKVYRGLVPGVTRENFERALTAGDIEQVIRARPVRDAVPPVPSPAESGAMRATRNPASEDTGGTSSAHAIAPVRQGDCLFVPPGTVHALGAGILAIEIQTPADTTFRLHDFGRIDPATGKPCELQIREALDCIHFDRPQIPAQPRSHVAGLFTTVTRLITCEDFIIEKVRFVEGVEEAVPYDQPVVWIMLEGSAEIRVGDLKDPISFGRGDTVLIPAKMKNPIIKTLAKCVWLEITFPTKGGSI